MSDSPAQTTNYRYGLLAPLNWGEDCEEELRKQTALWNRLVDIERAHRERMRGVARTQDAIRSIDANHAKLLAKRHVPVGERKVYREAAGSEASAADPDAETANAQACRRERAGQLKLNPDAANAAVRRRLHELEQQRIAAVKLARQSSGLFWSNCNAVIGVYETTRRRAFDTRTGLQHHHDASSHLTNQIQGGMTVDELISGQNSQVRIGPKPDHLQDRGGRMWRKGRRVLSLVATVYARASERRTVTWPIIMDRPLPSDACIQTVSVHRRRLADRWIWSASFAMHMPMKHQTTGPRVAVNLTWHQTPAGLRAATILVEGSDRPAHVFVPLHLIEAIERCRQYRRRSRKEMSPLRRELCSIEARRDVPDALHHEISGILRRQNLSPWHLMLLGDAWTNIAPEWHSKFLSQLIEWVNDNRRAWRIDAHRRYWIREAQRKHYEAEVVRLIGNASEIVLNAAHDPPRAVRDGKKMLPPVRYQGVVAAPNMFRTVLANRARRTGARLVSYNGKHDECVLCAEKLVVTDQNSLCWVCHRCRATFDRDEHLCRLMLKRLVRGGSD